ncbi:MAG: MCE family protein [Deltaproteobacteria bacterium]|jgi:phospholipid/cholesterol/gamma-HCH transport system substrate-binding protein|nr:MCE family protein [Deltaproteobacteria bacterium]
MYSVKTELRVGLFILAALGVLVWMTVRLGGFRSSDANYYRVDAVFPQAVGLKVGVAVQIAGIAVGRVESIVLDQDQARVSMSVRKDVPLPVDSVAMIKAQGVLGDKYVEISPGNDTTRYLSSGGQITQTLDSPDISELLDKLGGVADDLKSLTSALAADGGGQELRDIVSNLRELSGNLNGLVKDSGPGLETTLASLGRTADHLENISQSLASGKGTLGQLINDDSLMREFRDALGGLREISDKIASGQGTLGRLVNDDTTINKIDDVLSSVETYLEKEQSTRVSVQFRADYLTRYNYLKGTANILIHTSPDRYYILGATGDYYGRYSRTDYVSGGQTWERDNFERGKIKINAQIAQRYYDLVVRAGVFESGVGMGLDWQPLDDLTVTLEGFSGDFDHQPHLRALAMWRFWKFFYLGGGMDDFISDEGRDSPFVSFGLFFTDDDLKFLLGSAGSLLK